MAVVHADRTGCDRVGQKPLGGTVVGGTEEDIDAGEGILLGLAHDDLLTLEVEFLARRTGTCERNELCHGEVTLREALHHLLSDDARCA